MDRLLAPSASEAAEGNVRRPVLRGAINRSTVQATEKDVQWRLVHHQQSCMIMVAARGYMCLRAEEADRDI